jgi:hypothetical protein
VARDPELLDSGSLIIARDAMMPWDGAAMNVTNAPEADHLLT